MNTRIEVWKDYKIRFVELESGEWWAVLKDICDALGLKTWDVSQRIPAECMERVSVESVSQRPVEYKKSDIDTTGVSNFKTISRTQDMLVVNELGIYEALFASRKLEARQFRAWAATIMQRLRKFAGLESYEVMKMTDKKYQDIIDDILDRCFFDETDRQLKIGVTVRGGDVEIVTVDQYIDEDY